VKATIEVKDRKEADAIRIALADPVVYASVVIIGLLKPFSKRAQTRILTYVTDKMDEDEESHGPDETRA